MKKDLIISWDVGIKTLSYAISVIDENKHLIVKVVKMIDLSQGDESINLEPRSLTNWNIHGWETRLEKYLQKWSFQIFHPTIKLCLIEDQPSRDFIRLQNVIMKEFQARNIKTLLVHPGRKYKDEDIGKYSYAARKELSVIYCSIILNKDAKKNRYAISKINQISRDLRPNPADAILICAGFHKLI